MKIGGGKVQQNIMGIYDTVSARKVNSFNPSTPATSQIIKTADIRESVDIKQST